jgi:hypothetical protein
MRTQKTPEQIAEIKRIFDLLVEGKKITAKGKVISIKPNANYPTTNYTIATEKGLLAWFATTCRDFNSVRKLDYVEVEFQIKGKSATADNAFFIFGKCPKLLKCVPAALAPQVNP